MTKPRKDRCSTLDSDAPQIYSPEHFPPPTDPMGKNVPLSRIPCTHNSIFPSCTMLPITGQLEDDFVASKTELTNYLVVLSLTSAVFDQASEFLKAVGVVELQNRFAGMEE